MKTSATLSDIDLASNAAPATNAWSWLAAAALAVFYLATSIYIASHRLLWLDEVFTVRVARLPQWTTIWAALAHAVDSQPPIYYMVVRIFDRTWPGHGDVTSRLPSALGMIAGLLLTFDCARRLTNGLHGLIALSLLTCSLLPYYAYEARPYALYFMFSAFAFWIWTCTRDDSKRAAFFFGAVLGLAVTMHYYAVLNIVPYAAWEISRWKPWRRPSPKLAAGLLGVTIPAMFLAPLILSFARQFGAKFGGAPSFWLLGLALKSGFSEFFPDGLFLLTLIMVLIALQGRKDKSITLQPMQSSEALGWLFLCIPLAGFVVALRTNAFMPRYFIGAMPGIAVAFSCWLWRHCRNSVSISVVVFLIFASWGLAKQVTAVRKPEPIRWQQQIATRHFLSLEDSLQKDGKRFIVFSRDSLYLSSQYYAKYPEECILLRSAQMFPLEEHLAQYYPLNFWSQDDIKQHVRETALIAPSPAVVDFLRKSGLKVEFRFSHPLEVVYVQ